ncbi:MAG: hypothetical protein KH355_09605 [Clostridiales bacterium]|uniref:Uncharacterized protein n=1 Tax=Candidatus Scybalomonas excrementavium TaxID=2840943 RepID=A0A9D9HYF0_9FIRM|nr:hypothetical protein [Candidatus Scybalomonas excrementavium]MBS6560512.1 hypothetical protein [Clostridiales bacterium]
MDIKDRLEEMVVELEYIDSVLNCIYDGYFMLASEQEIKLERYGNMTALSIKLLEQQKEKLNQVVEILYKKRYDYSK